MKQLFLTLAVTLFSYGAYAQTNTFPSSGNVGIGTTSPGSLLELVGTGVTAETIAGAFPVIQFQDITSGGNAWNIEGGRQLGSFDIYSGTSGQVFTVLAGGNIGVGTTSPQNKFVVSNAGAGGIEINPSLNYLGANGTWLTTYNRSTSAYQDIMFDVGGLATTDVVIKATTGNVGIGTTSPGAKLDVNGTARLGGGVDYGSTIVVSVAPGTISFDAPGNPGGRFYISGSTGNIGIGTTTPDQLLSVAGTIHAKEVKVDLIGWPDYVFKSKYKLTSLNEVKAYIDKNKHLPGMPSEQEVKKNGINLGEMNKLLTKKVEELTLYLIDKDKQMSEQDKKNEQQDARIADLETALTRLTANR